VCFTAHVSLTAFTNEDEQKSKVGLVLSASLKRNIFVPDGWYFVDIVPEQENGQPPFKQQDVSIAPIPDPVEKRQRKAFRAMSITRFWGIQPSHMSVQKLAWPIFKIKKIDPTMEYIGLFECYSLGPFFDVQIGMWYYQRLLIDRSTATAFALSTSMHNEDWQKYWPIMKATILSNEKLITQ